MNKISKSYGRAIAVICLLCLLLSFGTVTASAQDTVKITASSSTVERGDCTSVSFNLEGNPGIWGFKLRLHYDDSALTLKSVTTGSVFDSDELVMSETLNTEPYIVVASGNTLTNKTTDGTIITLNFVVNSTAAFKSYPVKAEISQVINVAGENISVTAVDGGVTVAECKHTNKEWRLTTAPGCENEGTETLTCIKCNSTFETRAVNATGHINTEIRNAVKATVTVNGYTGDTYCNDCGKKIGTGNPIAKLIFKPISSDTDSDDELSDNEEPAITSGERLVYLKNSNTSLVFVSDADFSEFIRAEIDGNTLDENNYTATSGSTIITVKPEYLNTLSEGEHTVSIVSKSGTANAQFKVQNEAAKPDTDVVPPSDNNSDDTNDNPTALPIIIVVVIIVLLAAGAAVYCIIKKRRSL